MNPVKKCHVCGDSATGFNYNGLSCESCKVFFHRNSSKLSELSCVKESKCPVNKLNRKDCPKCRLEKCFLIGMRRKAVECSSADREIHNGIEKFFEISILKRITKTDITNLAEYVSLFPKNRKLLQLNQYELQRISEAQNAQNVFPDERNCTIVGTIFHKDQVQSLLSSSEFYIRKAINFCQNIPAFNNLNPGDQLALLKPFIFDGLAIRFAFLVDLQAKGILMFANDSGKEVIFVHETVNFQYKEQDFIETARQFTIALKNAMENDMIIRDLLLVLSLFKSYDNISCPEFVRYQYFLYTQVLIRYLEHKYNNKKEAKRKYHQLVNLASQIPMVKANKKQILDEFDISMLPPIILELYDLV